MGAGRGGAGGANKTAASAAGRERDADAARSESESAGGGVQTDTADCGSCGFAAKIFCAAGGGVCRAGIDSGFAGDLWGDLVLGDAADTGDGDTDGGGCGAGKGADGGDLEDAAVGDGWDWWGGGGVGGGWEPSVA